MIKQKIVALLLCLALLPLFSIKAGALRAYNLASQAVVLMDYETGQILFEKNMNERMYPASTTKIMTAILAVENSFPAELMVTSESAVDIAEPQSANISLEPDEQITVEDGLQAMMLPSANDAANVIAEYIAGSQQTFAAMMTAKAHMIGAVNTNFTNAHGLHEPEHYTTAHDLALITRYAAGDNAFMRYFGSSAYTMPATNKTADERSFTNHQSMLLPTSPLYNEYVTGGKVGFTTAAQNTMSTVAERGGRKLICVVMNSVNSADKFSDTEKLLEYGFDYFRTMELENAAFKPFSVPVGHGGEEVANVYFDNPQPFIARLHIDFANAGINVEYDMPKQFLKGQQPMLELTYSVAEAPEGTPLVLGTQTVMGRLEVKEPAVPHVTIEPDEVPLAAIAEGVKPKNYTGWVLGIWVAVTCVTALAIHFGTKKSPFRKKQI